MSEEAISSESSVVTVRLEGRRRIFAHSEEVDASNVVAELDNVISDHLFNASQINYLWKYWKGRQPIIYRTKDVRPEICNRIVENHAEEIVSFKVGYQLSEPVQYVSRVGESEGDGDKMSEAIKNLNTLMFAEDKQSQDHDLFEWMAVAGLGYRMVLPDKEGDYEEGGAPFEMFTLDPRYAFVAYSREYHHKPVYAVSISVDTHQVWTYSVYTRKEFFVIRGGRIIEHSDNTVGLIPIVEYDLDSKMMGAFENVLPLLDAVNCIESNRLDGIEQTVQSLMKFMNCDITQDDFIDMLKLGAVKVDSHDGVQGDVDIISNDLNQEQTQVTKDDLYSSIVRIAGVPNLSGSSGSTSDTGSAVLLRDGWTIAEAHAKSYELKYKSSEREVLRIIMRICDMAGENIKLRIRDVDMAFNRRNYENIQVKSQVLTTMLASDKIHPLLAFQSCGLFTDPEAAYLQSMKWMEKVAEEGGAGAYAAAGSSVSTSIGAKYQYVNRYVGVGNDGVADDDGSDDNEE